MFEDEKPKILVVDDDPALPLLICASSYMKAFKISAVSTGAEALLAAKEEPPDLFMLDFMLPDMNGIRLCQMLKADAVTKEIPVMFISSLDETARMTEAFRAGAIDYVVKPVIFEELAVRASTQVKLFLAGKKVAEYVSNMEALARERAKQLVHADRLASLGTMSAEFAHEIKNPATFISGNVQTLEKFWDVMKEDVESFSKSSAHQQKLQFILKEMPGLLGGIKDGVLRIVKIVDSLKAFSRKDSAGKAVFELNGCVDNALMLCHDVLRKSVCVARNVPAQGLLIRGDAQQIEQVLVNLITNAVDAMEGKKDQELSIEAFCEEGWVRFAVSDTGDGISPEKMEAVWDPFYTTKAAGKGTGLGLFICNSIISEHKGEIRAVRNKRGGMTFDIKLPLDCSSG